VTSTAMAISLITERTCRCTRFATIILFIFRSIVADETTWAVGNQGSGFRFQALVKMEFRSVVPPFMEPKAELT
jgi:hypothetical protein